MTPDLRRAAISHIVNYLDARESPDWVIAHTVDMLIHHPHWGEFLLLSRSDPDGHQWASSDGELRAAIGRRATTGDLHCLVDIAGVLAGLADTLAADLDGDLADLFPTEISPSAANTRADNDQPPQKNQSANGD